MIRLNGLPSILESIYLDEPLTARLQDIGIEVNPVTLKYLSGKLVIINSRDYVLGPDRGYGNTIISRISGIPGTKYAPYLPRVYPRIMWNGMTIGPDQDIDDYYIYESGTLYVPKIRDYQETGSDLDWLGYLEYQVGYNFWPDPKYQDLDILKCREGLI